MTKHKNNLREVAKFASGLMVGDFLVGVWFAAGGMLPMRFMGITFTAPMVAFWMVFDIVAIALLIYYGWHAEVHSPTVRQRSFFIAVGILLSVVAVAHFLRVLFAVALEIGTWPVPFWISWVAAIVTAFLAYTSFAFASQRK